MQTITAAELAQSLDTKPLIIDIREPEEYAAGHIPGSRNLPLSELEQRRHEIPEGAYLICRSGARTQMATQFLAANGQHVVDVLGGLLAWPAELEA